MHRRWVDSANKDVQCESGDERDNVHADDSGPALESPHCTAENYKNGKRAGQDKDHVMSRVAHRRFGESCTE